MSTVHSPAPTATGATRRGGRRPAPAPKRELAALLNLDPDLGNLLPPEAWEPMRRLLTVTLESFPSGRWQPELAGGGRTAGVRALLVVDGLLAREVRVGARVAAEVFGPGDVIHPGTGEERPYPVSWKGLSPGRVALLDDQLFETVARSLPLLFALASRTTRRGRSLGALALTRAMRRTDERLMFLLTLFATRWGRVRPDGIRLRLGVSHELLARLIGTRRQSVTTSLGQLRERGLISSLPDGDWLLHSRPFPEDTPSPVGVARRILSREAGEELVSLPDCDPELAAVLSPAELERARVHVCARTRTLPQGWCDIGPPESGTAGLGLLIVEGFLARETRCGQDAALEVMGPGDLLRPWDDLGDECPLPDVQTFWRALAPTRLAILDRELARRLALWPALTGELLTRAGRRAGWLAARLAISQQTSLRSRLLLLFEHLGARWGERDEGTLRVPVALTHEQIAQLVGAQRPSVTAALVALRDEGSLVRDRDGGWLLLGRKSS